MKTKTDLMSQLFKMDYCAAQKEGLRKSTILMKTKQLTKALMAMVMIPSNFVNRQLVGGIVPSQEM